MREGISKKAQRKSFSTSSLLYFFVLFARGRQNQIRKDMSKQTEGYHG